ncbi:MAG TPA: PP2C family protein-serine/threonine phosphatase [Phycisphaerae bacterium]|nr:PP2C family protein-serine/threonine phosphatase [Phycisphaerae bacterium]HNU44864.1 PP2C family protein-serine/threonine phosphatase [Phycisphaerae bacterium]
MSKVPRTTAETKPSGTATPDGSELVGLVCNEVWGGNRAFYGPVELPGLRGVLYSQASDGTRGGDVHYLSVCGSGLISRACLADVTGHGESVAAISQTMHDLLRRSVNRMDERKVLQRLNFRLCARGEGPFVTAAALTYFPPTRRLSISYAGHEPAWYYDAARRFWSPLKIAPRDGLFDIALAVEPKTRYTRCLRRVALGDRLLLLTDGVVEAPNAAGELFGRERLAQVLQANGHQPPQVLIPTMVAALRGHTNRAPLHHDDVSLLMVEFVDNLKSNALWTAVRNRLLPRRRAGDVFKALRPAAP